MIIDTFDNKTEAIINPAQVAPPIDGFPKVAVAAFGDRFIHALHEHHATKQITEMSVCVKVPVYQITHNGRDLAVYCSMLGGPASAAMLELMISKGCEKFIFFGSCGVLKSEIAANSLIVPTAAYRDEGTSYHYAPPGEFIEVTTAQKLSAMLSELESPHVCGKTWTTDAFFRETRGSMKKRKNAGCIAVEMECASVMAAAQFRGVEAYQFFYAADNLDATEWDARTLGNFPVDKTEKILRVALEVAKRI